MWKKSVLWTGVLVFSLVITGCSDEEDTASGSDASNLIKVKEEALAEVGQADGLFDDRETGRNDLIPELLDQQQTAQGLPRPGKSRQEEPLIDLEIIKQPKAPTYPPYQRVAAFKNIRVLEGAQSSVTNVVSIGPNRVMSHDYDGVFRVWETEHGMVRKFCEGYFGEVSDIASDGRLVVLSAREGIEVVDPWNCVTLVKLRLDKNVTTLRLSPDAQRLEGFPK